MTALITPIDALKQIQTLVTEGLSYVPPPPPPVPTPPIDVLSWWIPKAGKATKPTFVRLLPDGRTAVYFIKNSAGWPFDIQTADDKGVYFRVTENDAISSSGLAVGWPPNGSPQAYRIYTGVNPSGSLGFKISPRYYQPSDGRILVTNATDVPTLRYANCGSAVAGHLGPAASYISMQTIDFGGILGSQQSIVCEYYYTRTQTGYPAPFMALEKFYLTADSGWVQWDISTQQKDGTYKLNKPPSVHNQFIGDDVLVPVQPCPILL